jgi:hypothetical protein
MLAEQLLSSKIFLELSALAVDHCLGVCTMTDLVEESSHDPQRPAVVVTSVRSMLLSTNLQRQVAQVVGSSDFVLINHTNILAELLLERQLNFVAVKFHQLTSVFGHQTEDDAHLFR